MDKNLIKKIILESINAPSGENSQPWKFVCYNNQIDLYNLPDRDNPIYNYKQHGSLFAHGALLENISIVAGYYGYKIKIDFLPDITKDLVASIFFSEKEDKSLEKDNLFYVLKDRTTNRKKYDNKKISEDILSKLKIATDNEFGIKIFFVDQEKNRVKMSKIFSINDAITLEDEKLHSVFFDNIRWSKEEENMKKSGIFLDTMELAPPQQKIFKMLRNHNVAKFFRKVRLTRFIAHENAKVYSSSPLFVSFVIENKEENYIKAGIIAEKLWLTAMSNGLYCQPLAALPYLYDRVKNSGEKHFSDNHEKLIKSSYKEMCSILSIDNSEMIAMTIRVGYGKKPSAISSKMTPEIIFV